MSRCIIEILWSFDFNMDLTYCGLLPDDLLQNEHFNCSFDLSYLMSLVTNWRGIFGISNRNIMRSGNLCQYLDCSPVFKFRYNILIMLFKTYKDICLQQD